MPDLLGPMVEKAARALYNDTASYSGTEDWWAGASEPDRDSYRRAAFITLAAALEGCDVREQTGLRQAHPTAPGGILWDSEFGPARELYDEWMSGPRGEWDVTLVSRLVITTSPEAAPRSNTPSSSASRSATWSVRRSGRGSP
jgi:hypothetical protein